VCFLLPELILRSSGEAVGLKPRKSRRSISENEQERPMDMWSASNNARQRATKKPSALYCTMKRVVVTLTGTLNQFHSILTDACPIRIPSEAA
jgi:hypothetical protein